MRVLRLNSVERRRALRFAIAGNLIPVAVATATDFGSHRTVFFIGAIGACIAPIVVTTVTRRHPIPFYLAVFGGLPALTMLQAYSGGAASGYAVLMMMAMIWFGLQATDRELVAGLVVLAACAYLPMLIFGPPAYPVDWGHATLLVIVGASIAGSLRAVTRETIRLTERLRQEAVRDELTGVLNRRGWEAAGRRELARSERSASKVGLVIIDLDGLKEINDSMGHDEGDRLLRESAERISAALRSGDILARIGGDEFAAMLADATLDDVLGVVKRLRDVTPSIGSFSTGVASWDGHESLEQLMRRTDTALYAAKAGGGDQVELAPVTLEPDQARSQLDRPFRP